MSAVTPFKVGDHVKARSSSSGVVWRVTGTYRNAMSGRWAIHLRSTRTRRTHTLWAEDVVAVMHR